MSDKFVGSVRKLDRWRGQVDWVNLDMFPTLDEFLMDNDLNWDVTKKEIILHLQALSAHFNK